MSLAEAAEFTGYSQLYLRRLKIEKKVPYVQRVKGGKFYFEKSALEKWLNRGTRRYNCDK